MAQHPIKDNYRLTDKFGSRVRPDGVRDSHLGQDYACEMRTPVYPINPGVVEKVERNHNIYGNYVVVRHNDNYRSLYAHFHTTPNVVENQQVDFNTWLGGVGHSGLSFGDHLHLGVCDGPIKITRNGVIGKMINPLGYIGNMPATAGEVYDVLTIEDKEWQRLMTRQELDYALEQAHKKGLLGLNEDNKAWSRLMTRQELERLAELEAE